MVCKLKYDLLLVLLLIFILWPLVYQFDVQAKQGVCNVKVYHRSNLWKQLMLLSNFACQGEKEGTFILGKVTRER